ncbi:MAG: hypothetical protein ACI4U5_03450 [Bacilli bacterium]
MIYLIGILLYVIALLFYFFCKKKNFYIYEIIITVIYLLTLSFVQTLDITLVLYLVFAIIPFVQKIKFRNLGQIIAIISLSIILLVSIILNGASEAISVFVIRLIGLIFFVFFFSSLQIDDSYYSEENIKKALYLLIIAEFAIGMLGFFLSDDKSRLMLNYQCTVGCISISGILFLLIYLHKVCDSKLTLKIFLIGIYFCIWPIWSGTRGYTVITLGMMALIFLFFAKKQEKIISFSFIIILFLVNFDYIWDLFLSVTRMSDSTGIRDAENSLFMLIERDSPLINIVFGYGYGNSVSNIDNILSKVEIVAYDEYSYYILQQKASFHNFYTTIFYSSGVYGFLVVLYLFLYIFSEIKHKVKQNKYRFLLYAYVILYMFILWYRWTATSGILEFATLALCITYFSNYIEEKENASEEKNEICK